MAGPSTRDALNMEEFSAMAFIRSALPTISTMNDWRAGMSKALTTPSSAERTKICQIRTVPVSVTAASASANSMDSVWVAITSRWRLYRSAAMPPSVENRKMGIWLQKLMPPSRTIEPVSR